MDQTPGPETLASVLEPTPGPEAALPPEALASTLEPPPTRSVAVRAHRPKKGRNFLIGAVIGIVLLGAIVVLAQKNAPSAPDACAAAGCADADARRDPVSLTTKARSVRAAPRPSAGCTTRACDAAWR